MQPGDFQRTDQRPDPDALLAQVQDQERRASRGRLRIYFGASAGVGKTYAMLNAGRKLAVEKIDVIVGVVETHGRSETAAQLEGLTLLPLRGSDYRGKAMAEFDIDAALARQPSLILMDELAHTNVAGSRHAKRWQDVEELLAAGIDVFTTVNVQHLESLNDVVGGITGVRVAETLPDKVFDHADEVVLVDVPADELLARLKAGKVYGRPQAERASQNFFRKGNLIALRELALRRTADRIGDDVQAYRIEKSIDAVWKTDAALLALVGPLPGSEQLVRSAARLATQLNTDWHAIYVETPRLQRLPSTARERILTTLKLAQDLGATTAVLSGNEVADAAAGYARSHNFSKVVLGRARSPVWMPWRISIGRKLVAQAPDIDLIELGGGPGSPRADASVQIPLAADDDRPQRPGRQIRYLWAAGASVATTLLASPLSSHLDLANIVMIYLLTVVVVAMHLGRGPATLSTLVSVAIFDYFFVEPRFSFEVSDLQYGVTFGVMLIVGVVIAHLTASLRYQARIASHRETRARALYEFARELSGALQTEQIFDTTCRFIENTFGGRATLLLPDADGKLTEGRAGSERASSHRHGSNGSGGDGEDGKPGIETGIAQWAFDHATPAGVGTDTLAASAAFYMPLVAPMRTRGVLAIVPQSRRWILIPEQRQQFDTFAALTAIALERVHYIEVAQGALVHMESERLRNSLLAALSHDLRTPLTSLVGLSESLTRSQPALDDAQLSLAHALHDEALRMSNLVANLLDMARIQSGKVELNLQWQPLEEVVGSALRACGQSLTGHQVQTRLPPQLPLVRFDALLLERVLCNLVENAVKYTPAGSCITIAARVVGRFMQVSVSDNGPGLPVGRERLLFEKFTRGEQESATTGVGLGLAICQAIVEAHGGIISAVASDAAAPDARGACIVFTLPLGTPPALPAIED
jgi:two-component system sensor histidine kinase KdpD